MVREFKDPHIHTQHNGGTTPPEFSGCITSKGEKPPPAPLIEFKGSSATDTVEVVVTRELAARIGCTVQFAGAVLSFAIAERSQLREVVSGRLGLQWRYAPAGLCDALLISAQETYWQKFHD